MSSLEIQAREEQLWWENNSVLVQLLGLSPVLAVSTSLLDGFVLGLATFVVLVLSCLTVSAFRQHISTTWRLYWFMIILASYTTVIDIVLQWFYFPLYLRLGIYVPLICCNVAILISIETVAFRSGVKTSCKDALKIGCGYLFAILLFSTIRELLITGGVFANSSLLFPSSENGPLLDSNTELFAFAATQPGALILFGLLLALMNVLNSSVISKGNPKKKQVIPIKRARVTGRLTQEDIKS